MRDDEREMLRSSLRRLLEETDEAKVDEALRQFGWHDLLADEPDEAVPALFEAQGEGVHATPMLNAVMAPVLLDDPSTRDGNWAVVLPPGRRGGAPQSVLDAGGTLRVEGYCLGPLSDESRILVAARRGDEMVVACVERCSLDAVPVAGMDPARNLLRVTAMLASCDVDISEGRRWDAAVAAGRRALAHELIGISRTALRLAVAHAGERRQFGKPIGSYQAVKHRLAEAQVAVTAAELAATEAWTVGDPAGALLAKLWAGRSARTVGSHAQQVLGGMGFTWEHPFHHLLRRALVDDALLGSAGELTAQLGRRLLTDRTLLPLAVL